MRDLITGAMAPRVQIFGENSLGSQAAQIRPLEVLKQLWIWGHFKSPEKFCDFRAILRDINKQIKITF